MQRVVWTLDSGLRPVRHEIRFVFRYRLERIVLLRRSFTYVRHVEYFYLTMFGTSVKRSAFLLFIVV